FGDATPAAIAPDAAPSNDDGDRINDREKALIKFVMVYVEEKLDEERWIARKERADERASEAGDRDAELGKLQVEVDQLRGALNNALKRLETSGKAVSRLAAQVTAEQRDRAALFDTLEGSFGELKAFVRGTVRDWGGA